MIDSFYLAWRYLSYNKVKTFILIGCITIIAFLPSPLDVPEIVGHHPKDPDTQISRPVDDSAPFSALAFKVMTDPYVGKLTYIRLYSGTIKAGSYIFNSIF